MQEALSTATAAGLASMRAKLPTLARVMNGWQLNTDTMGAYGNFYMKRAIVAMVGLEQTSLRCDLSDQHQRFRRQAT